MGSRKRSRTSALAVDQDDNDRTEKERVTKEEFVKIIPRLTFLQILQTEIFFDCFWKRLVDENDFRRTEDGQKSYCCTVCKIYRIPQKMYNHLSGSKHLRAMQAVSDIYHPEYTFSTKQQNIAEEVKLKISSADKKPVTSSTKKPINAKNNEIPELISIDDNESIGNSTKYAPRKKELNESKKKPTESADNIKFTCDNKSNATCEDLTKISSDEEKFKIHGFLGVEYVIKISANNMPWRYECALCEINLDFNDMQNHLLCYSHQLKFCEQHFPTAMQEFNKHIVNIPTHTHAKFMQKLAQAIERYHGRARPFDCTKNRFKTERIRVLAEVFARPHASEANGPKFRNFFNSKESIEQEPPKKKAKIMDDNADASTAKNRANVASQNEMKSSSGVGENKVYGFIGVEYVVKVCGDNVRTRYVCGLCRVSLNFNRMQKHLLNYCHRIKFCNKHFPSAIKQCRQYIRQYVVSVPDGEHYLVMIPVLQKLAEAIEKHHGRQQPLECSQQQFEKEQIRVIGKKCALLHASEKNGPTFTDVVSVKDVNFFISKRSTFSNKNNLVKLPAFDNLKHAESTMNYQQKSVEKQTKTLTPSLEKKGDCAPVGVSGTKNKLNVTSPDKSKQSVDEEETKVYGFIGVEYVIKTCGDDVRTRYVCGLCGVSLNFNDMQKHLLNYSHRIKYCEKHFPSAIKQCRQYIRQYVVSVPEDEYYLVMIPVLQKLAEAIEKHHGRLQPLECSQKQFEKEQSCVLAQVFALPHASEKNGPTFTNVVSVKDVNFFISKRSTFSNENNLVKLPAFDNMKHAESTKNYQQKSGEQQTKTLTPSLDKRVERTPVDASDNKNKPNVTSIDKSKQSVDKEETKVYGFIGVEYVIKICGDDVRTRYVCSLCGVSLNFNDMQNHLLNYSHRIKFCEKHFPSVIKQCRQYIRQYVLSVPEDEYYLVMIPVLQKLAEAIEKHYGRLQPLECSQKQFEKEHSCVLAKVCALPHASENNGPTFTNVVSVKDVNFFISKRSTFSNENNLVKLPVFDNLKNVESTKNYEQKSVEQQTKTLTPSLEKKAESVQVDGSCTKNKPSVTSPDKSKESVVEDENKVCGFIGVEYVVKIWDNDLQTRYACGLCEVTLNFQDMQKHLLNYSHRMKFCEKHFPTVIKQCRQYIRQYVLSVPEDEYYMVLIPVLQKLAKAIEQHHGRQQPLECSKKRFEKEHTRVFAEVLARAHASEENGPTFTNVVRVKDVNFFISKRDTFSNEDNEVKTPLFDYLKDALSRENNEQKSLEQQKKILTLSLETSAASTQVDVSSTNKANLTSPEKSKPSVHKDESKIYGFIGIEYVVKVWNDDLLAHYECGLCEIRLGFDEMQSHLLDYSHRLKFCEKHFPTAIEKCRRYIRQYIQYVPEDEHYRVLAPMMQKLATAIEKHHGRAKPFECSQKRFEQEHSQVLTEVFARSHASEEDGPAFTDLVGVKEVNVLISKRNFYSHQEHIVKEPIFDKKQLKAVTKISVVANTPSESQLTLPKMAQDIPQPKQQSLAQQRPQTIPQLTPPPIHQRMPHPIPPPMRPRMSRPIPQQIPLPIPQPVPYPSSPTMPQRLPHPIPQGMPYKMTQPMQQPIPQPMQPMHQVYQVRCFFDTQPYNQSQTYMSPQSYRPQAPFVAQRPYIPPQAVVEPKSEFKLQQKVDDDLHKRMVDEFLKANKECQDRQDKSAYNRDSGSRSPPHTSVLKTEHLPDIWRSYCLTVDHKLKGLNECYQQYKENPESHPSYDEEWLKFWYRQKAELIAEGKDYRTHDYQPHWKSFFTYRITELYDEAFEALKIKTRQELSLPLTNHIFMETKYYVHAKSREKNHKRESPTEQAAFFNCQPTSETAKKISLKIEKPVEVATFEKQERETEISFKIEDEETPTLVPVLRLLTAFEENLGILGPKIVDLLTKALQAEKCSPAHSLALINEDNCTLLETAMEKFKGLVIVGLIDSAREPALKKAIAKVATFLEVAKKTRQVVDKRKSSTLQPIVEVIPKNKQHEIEEEIAALLIAQGKTTFDRAELKKLATVCLLVDKKKREAAKAAAVKNLAFNSRGQSTGQRLF